MYNTILHPRIIVRHKSLRLIWNYSTIEIILETPGINETTFQWSRLKLKLYIMLTQHTREFYGSPVGGRSQPPHPGHYARGGTGLPPHGHGHDRRGGHDHDHVPGPQP